MALKSFHQETLNDNWFEERAEPLNRGLPYDEVTEYSTTARIDYAGAKPSLLRVKARLITDKSLCQALLQSAGASISQGFRSSLPRPNVEQERRYLETTHRASFGPPTFHDGRKVSSNEVPAGGPGGKLHEQGKSTSGAMGEVFKTHSEPQKDTSSQRAWLYTRDPMISTKKQITEVSNGLPNTCQNPDASVRKVLNFRRNSTSITNVPWNHQGVFTDD